MRGYYNRGVENNPFNFSIRSAGYLGTTKSNFFFFQYVQCLQVFLVIRSRLLTFVGGRGGGVCEVFKTHRQSINSINIYCALFVQAQAL